MKPVAIFIAVYFPPLIYLHQFLIFALEYMPAYGYGLFGVAYAVLLMITILVSGFRDRIFKINDYYKDIEEEEEEDDETEYSTDSIKPLLGAINMTAGINSEKPALSTAAELQAHKTPIVLPLPPDDLLIKVIIYAVNGLVRPEMSTRELIAHKFLNFQLMAGIAAGISAFFWRTVWWEEMEATLLVRVPSSNREF